MPPAKSKPWIDNPDKFGIFQSQLSRAWCLVWPVWVEDKDTEWFNTWGEAWEAYGIAVRQLSARY